MLQGSEFLAARLILAAVMLLAWTAAADARDEWTIVETDRFRVYGRADADWMTRRAAQLERFDHLLRKYTGVSADPLPPRMNVFLADKRSMQHINKSALGVYTATPDGICAFSPRKGGRQAIDILQHEYTHHFMLQHFPVAYPEWFIEGFAEFFMTADIDTQSAEVGRFSKYRVQWLANRDWLPLAAVLRGERADRDQSLMFYAQSWLLTHYLYSSPEGREQLGEYLAAYAAGEQTVPAFERVFGESPASFQGKLRSYFDGGRITYKRLEFGEDLYQGGEVRTVELPASSDDLMEPWFAISCGVGDSAELLAEIREEAEDERGDAFAERIRAFAEAEAGDTGFAIPVLTRIIAATPDDPDALYYLGRAHSRRAHEEGQDMDADHAAARGYYARAFELRPDHYQTLFYYAHDGHALGDAERDLLRRARELAPQVMEVNVSLAVALAANGEFEAAETVLTPVANNPHLRADHGGLATLMQRIRARDGTLGGDSESRGPEDGMLSSPEGEVADPGS